jgi:hypothetical protein
VNKLISFLIRFGGMLTINIYTQDLVFKRSALND